MSAFAYVSQKHSDDAIWFPAYEAARRAGASDEWARAAGDAAAAALRAGLSYDAAQAAGASAAASAAASSSAERRAAAARPATGGAGAAPPVHGVPDRLVGHGAMDLNRLAFEALHSPATNEAVIALARENPSATIPFGPGHGFVESRVVEGYPAFFAALSSNGYAPGTSVTVYPPKDIKPVYPMDPDYIIYNMYYAMDRTTWLIEYHKGKPAWRLVGAQMRIPAPPAEDRGEGALLPIHAAAADEHP